MTVAPEQRQKVRGDGSLYSLVHAAWGDHLPWVDRKLSHRRQVDGTQKITAWGSS